MTRTHAILSASGSSRWMACPPSAQLEEQFPDEQSEYAAEGTFAHALAELQLSRATANTIGPRIYKKKLAALQKDEKFSKEMEDYIDLYVTQVSEIFMTARKKCPDAIALLEQRLDFSQWVPEGFGTGDAVIISDDAVEVIDLKYGKGVPISAQGNTQMRLYGLGALSSHKMLYDFSRVRMTIIQPRLDSISTEELTVDELLEWTETYVRPQADLAMKGEGEFTAGEHCRFCKARFTCRARAEKNLELAQYEFQKPALLDTPEIAEILFRAGELQMWAADLQKFALEQAEKCGVKYPGWKLIEGRSNRKYTDEIMVSKILLDQGYKEDDVLPRSLLGITAMEKHIGKKKFSDLLADCVIKPPGKPTLAPENDKRPELNSVQAATADFAEAV